MTESLRNGQYTPATMGSRHPIPKGTYHCPELGRTCMRPGAYDAFDLPSMYAGERKPYRFSKTSTQITE